jgi:hypothetical protein
MKLILSNTLMKKEDKQLLLVDLCARLPYGVHCCVFNFNKTIREDNDIIYGIAGDDILSLKSDKNECYMYHQIKPYLRPMSSMTEEENKKYKHLVAFSGSPYGASNFIDWLNAHHFDFRNIIEKGLAIEAPAGMYKTE